MATTNLVIPMDNELKTEAQSVLDGLGLDVTAAVNLIFKQIANKKKVPFEDEILNISKSRESIKQKRQASRGSMKGEIWMADDFNAPIDDMKEYM